MSNGTGPQKAFMRLWPTLMMSMELPGAETANPVLVQMLLEKDRAHADMTGDYLGGKFLEVEHPAVNWLRQCFQRAIADYSAEAGITYELVWSVQAWPNINMRGDYHNLHNHPHSWLSGTYYVAVPEHGGATHRTDLNPNAISFFDPRPQANMNAIAGDGQFDPEHRIQPKPGQLLLWPAFLHHLVHPNLSDEARISVSFNVVLKWRDSYLGMG
jgi:uncharacterized protein (TIGR02466 family)